jgi:hypothetical protein
MQPGEIAYIKNDSCPGELHSSMLNVRQVNQSESSEKTDLGKKWQGISQEILHTFNTKKLTVFISFYWVMR